MQTDIRKKSDGKPWIDKIWTQNQSIANITDENREKPSKSFQYNIIHCFERNFCLNNSIFLEFQIKITWDI